MDGMVKNDEMKRNKINMYLIIKLIWLWWEINIKINKKNI